MSVFGYILMFDASQGPLQGRLAGCANFIVTSHVEIHVGCKVVWQAVPISS
jgi:hypothetical protein